MASSLEKEVDELRGSEKKPRRFQAINTGTKHLIFVKCDSPVEPVQLVHHMLSDVMELGKQKASKVMFLLYYSTLHHSVDFVSALYQCLLYAILTRKTSRNVHQNCSLQFFTKIKLH